MKQENTPEPAQPLCECPFCKELPERMHDTNQVRCPLHTVWMPISDWIAAQPAQEEPCPVCGGEGGIDSGGVQPWGEGIMIPCPACNRQEERKDDGWRMLKVGEVIQEGDEFKSEILGRGWVKAEAIGCPVDGFDCYRRRISQPQGGEPTPVPRDLEALARTSGVNEFIQKRLNIAREGSGSVTWQQFTEVLSYIFALQRATELLVKERDAEREELEQLRHEKQQANSPMFSRRELLDNIARLTAELAEAMMVCENG